MKYAVDYYLSVTSTPLFDESIFHIALVQRFGVMASFFNMLCITADIHALYYSTRWI